MYIYRICSAVHSIVTILQIFISHLYYTALVAENYRFDQDDGGDLGWGEFHGGYGTQIHRIVTDSF